MSDVIAYSIKEFVKAFGIGRSKFYEEVKAGRIKTRKVGSRTLVAAVDAEAWLKSLPLGHVPPRRRK